MRLHIHKALILVAAATAGCGSSKSTVEPPQPDAAVPDATQQPDLPKDTFVKLDVIRPADAKVDKVLPSDTAFETPPADTSSADTFVGPTPDAFVPGPVEPLVVNSGNTAKYDLADGTWKVFSFDTVQGHFYCLGVLADGVEAYLSQSPTVSPTDYNEKTNYLRALNFTSNSGGKYYLAVAANGAGASGSFQIAEGGDLLELGENTIELKGDDTAFFNFSVAPGHSYSISVTGNAKNPVSLGLSPLADRSTAGQFAFPLSTKSSALPITDEPVPLESVAKSSSRLYFLSVKVQEAVSLTIKIDLAS